MPSNWSKKEEQANKLDKSDSEMVTAFEWSLWLLSNNVSADIMQNALVSKCHNLIVMNWLAGEWSGCQSKANIRWKIIIIWLLDILIGISSTVIIFFNDVLIILSSVCPLLTIITVALTHSFGLKFNQIYSLINPIKSWHHLYMLLSSSEKRGFVKMTRALQKEVQSQTNHRQDWAEHQLTEQLIK